MIAIVIAVIYAHLALGAIAFAIWYPHWFDKNCDRVRWI